MHSPFVYRFIRDVLNDKKQYPEYGKIEMLRRTLLKDNTAVSILELGAGTSGTGGDTRTVSSIAHRAAKSPRLAQLLFRITRYYRPGTILELGTSLGISAAYLQSGHTQGSLTTLEGSPQVASRARLNFEALGLKPLVVEGNFDDTLAGLLEQQRKPDLVFVDGNHRVEPTLRYFSMLLPHMQNDSVIIFDDIHWSAEMEEAWASIHTHPQVRCSVDLFYFGIVFFRNEFREKRHFRIRF